MYNWQLIKVTANNSIQGEVLLENGEKLLTDSTNRSFYYHVISGNDISYLQFLGPQESKWEIYEEGTIISKTSENGRYSFRAVDIMGNISDVSYVILDTVSPYGHLYDIDKEYLDNKSVTIKSFSFEAIDDLSGVDCIYVKGENETSYSLYENRKLINKSGQYSFYITDYAGNKSLTYQIKLDNSPPVIYTNLNDFYITTDSSFWVGITDHSLAKLFFKTPSMSSFEEYNDLTYNVSIEDEDGCYYFYGLDVYDNKSKEVWIEKTSPKPKISIIKDDETNSFYITWDDDLIVKINEQIYIKEKIISKEGNYQIIVEDMHKRQATYEYELGHAFKLSQTILPTCNRVGYSIYYCCSCNSTLERDFLPVTAHNFQVEEILPSCIEDGYKLNICQNCGFKDKIKTIEAYGHNWEKEVRLVTCNEDGGEYDVCRNCTAEKVIKLIKSTGHQYNTMVLENANCQKNGVRLFSCLKCDYEYSIDIPKKEHYWTLALEETVDDKIIQTYICQDCGEKEIKEIIKKTSVIENKILTVLKVYQDNILIFLLITTGLWSIYMGIEYIIAWKKEDKILAKRKIKNYLLGLIVIFMLLLIAPMLIIGINSFVN